MCHLLGNPNLILFWYDYFLFGCAQNLVKYINNCEKIDNQHYISQPNNIIQINKSGGMGLVNTFA